MDSLKITATRIALIGLSLTFMIVAIIAQLHGVDALTVSKDVLLAFFAGYLGYNNSKPTDTNVAG